MKDAGIFSSVLKDVTEYKAREVNQVNELKGSCEIIQSLKIFLVLPRLLSR